MEVRTSAAPHSSGTVPGKKRPGWPPRCCAMAAITQRAPFWAPAEPAGKEDTLWSRDPSVGSCQPGRAASGKLLPGYTMKINHYLWSADSGFMKLVVEQNRQNDSATDPVKMQDEAQISPRPPNCHSTVFN